MRRQPAKNNRSKRSVSRTQTVHAPTGGINSLDSLTDMKANEAIQLINMIPTERGCESRGGKSPHGTGINSTVRSLLSFSQDDGDDELFAATSTNIYDVTASGDVGSAVVSSTNSGYWQQTNFSNDSGNFLIICNGADNVKYYNGSAWVEPQINNVASNKLINVATHMSRLWFVEEDSLSAWYLAPNAIAGDATEINLGPISSEGGYLVAMASWTRDGGDGMDDVAVFVTSKGQVHIYSGSDPSSIETWSRVGTYQIAPPVGRNCLEKFGADVGVLTSQGLIPLSSVLGLALSAQREAAATNSIRGDIQEYFNVNSALNGWQFIEVFEEGFLLINVPVTDGVKYTQFVMSTRAGGKWGQFDALNATAWQKANGKLYFADIDGTVYRYGAEDDNGIAIESTIIHAFSDFGAQTEKSFKRFRPQFFGQPGYTPRVGIRIDYNEDSVEYEIPAPSPFGAEWGNSLWDDASWAPTAVSSAKWYSIRGEGYSAAIIVKLSSREPVRYDGGKILFTVSNGI